MEIRRLSLKVSGDEKTPLVKVETAARFGVRSSKARCCHVVDKAVQVIDCLRAMVEATW